MSWFSKHWNRAVRTDGIEAAPFAFADSGRSPRRRRRRPGATRWCWWPTGSAASTCAARPWLGSSGRPVSQYTTRTCSNGGTAWAGGTPICPTSPTRTPGPARSSRRSGGIARRPSGLADLPRRQVGGLRRDRQGARAALGAEGGGPTVERAVLLAPALSPGYDLAPALRERPPRHRRLLVAARRGRAGGWHADLRHVGSRLLLGRGPGRLPASHGRDRRPPRGWPRTRSSGRSGGRPDEFDRLPREGTWGRILRVFSRSTSCLCCGSSRRAEC